MRWDAVMDPLEGARSQPLSKLPRLTGVITTLIGAMVNPRVGERIYDFLSPRPERRPQAAKLP
jgi:hypothetical protein